ncbi:MAG: hypothetical protein JAY96_21875 [Candidatus Thiodiazotropha endolucinida]|nr:hypothetical protein [Candidatus Thiodiazotropha taylori]MCW4250844.1 hypothetical protein [Candidatus Thiodiazotropha endolucinida]MCG8040106.1 hypothetical protein [Candidatus Thiodiazotropha taylori]MCG8104562.1 hypothetical protein [Candidatus Thiodiazotropha taylori]MCG8121838.1 hypothetical protein [Candidatus Thiodiazotropha taylori]
MSDYDPLLIGDYLVMHIFSKEKFVLVYLPHITSEEDANEIAIAPIVYIWNENRKARSFTVSVNGKAIGCILEEILPRTHPEFSNVRDYVLNIIADISNRTVLETCNRLGMFPSELFQDDSLCP